MARRGRGEGTISYDPDRKRWQGRITVDIDERGWAVRKKVVGRTRNEVVARLRELRAATDSGQEPVAKDLTVATYMTQWLNDVLPGTVAATTETQYRDVVRLYIIPKLGRKRLRTLTARDVARMGLDLEADGKSANTRRLARSILRRALRFAESEGAVARNVAAIAPGVRMDAPEGNALTIEQARTFLDSIHGHRLEAAFTVALALGLRRGELLGLTWDGVDLDADPPRLTVTRSLKRIRSNNGDPSTLALADTKTARSRRTIPLPARVAADLRAHRRRQVEERLAAGPEWVALPLGADLVFRAEFGTPLDPDGFRQATYRLTEAAGIGRWSPHAFRHSAATMLLAEGVDLKTISGTLGHSSLRVTADVYAHLGEPAKNEAADAIGRALWGER